MIEFNVYVPTVVKENLPYKNLEQISYNIKFSVKIFGKLFMDVSDFPIYDFVSFALWWVGRSKKSFEYMREGIDSQPWLRFSVVSEDAVQISSPYQKFAFDGLISKKEIINALEKIESDIRPSDEWYAQFASLR